MPANYRTTLFTPKEEHTSPDYIQARIRRLNEIYFWLVVTRQTEEERENIRREFDRAVVRERARGLGPGFLLEEGE